MKKKLVLLTTMAIAEGCMYLCLERDVFQTGCFVDGMKHYTGEPMGCILVAIIAQGEAPETFLTVPFIQGDNITVHPERHICSRAIHPPDTLIEVLVEIKPDGTREKVFDIKFIDWMSLATHDKATEMIDRLNKFRQQPDWIEWTFHEVFRRP